MSASINSSVASLTNTNSIQTRESLVVSRDGRLGRIRTDLLTRPVRLKVDAYRGRWRPRTPVPMCPSRTIPHRHPIPAGSRVLPVQSQTLAIPIRYKTVVVCSAIRGFPPRDGKDGVVAEEQEEKALELLPKDDVDDEVNARIDRHEQIARVDQLVEDGRVGDDVEGLHAVEHHGREVADEEHYHHAEEHGS